MLLILISIYFIVRPCLYSFIVTSFVLKGLRRRHQIFFRVSYYSKAGIDNTCIMIKKCLRAFKNIRKTYATCVDQNYFQGGLQRIIFFLSGEGGLSLIFWKLLGKLNNFILSTRSGPRLPRSAHRSECHLIMCTRQLLYAVVFLSACALWGGRNTIKYRKKIYTHVI